MTTSSPDPARCPLCKGPNECALSLPAEERPEECWCVAREFSRELTDRATSPTCICKGCLQRSEAEGS
ncbi:MAG: cysteine-rich CWC family protein [Myxococcota bacterium]